MKTLLHICCAPCSLMCIESLRGENIEPVGFWYNPNIHPYTEYKARKETLIGYAGEIDMELIVRDDYGLREFIKGIPPDFNERCGFCYSLRAEAAARYAAQNGFDSFTSTLLISPYQNHDLLCRVMKESAEKNGVEFLYRDFRPFFREGQKRAREKGFYMQKYCGCIFSEEERYLKKTKSK
ncbi:MAG: epoxyqueuosine reductase QueH [Lachnospiraceae bacterium]|nr:epoxyqueuosine reductase QueH [Lachnospiraceae bacterium]